MMVGSANLLYSLDTVLNALNADRIDFVPEAYFCFALWSDRRLVCAELQNSIEQNSRTNILKDCSSIKIKLFPDQPING